MSRKRAEAAEAERDDMTPVIEQGRSAKELGLSREACPYMAAGPLREAWLLGYDGED